VSPSLRVEQIMGMPIVVDVRDDEVESGALDAAFAWLREVDERFSTYDAGSEISRVNRGELHLRDAHPDVRAVLECCEQLRVATDGYFDVRAAGTPDVDPSGFVKGWAVVRAAAILESGGARNYCVNAGGDIHLRGDALPDRGWRIGIQHPRRRDEVAAVVVATGELAIATSGDYARGEHVLDPHTGLPPEGLLSVTITGPDLATADAYATAAFAMGRAGPEWTTRLEGYEALAITVDDRALRTPGFPA
jgi:thiamine biosynthesis lipoprotein